MTKNNSPINYGQSFETFKTKNMNQIQINDLLIGVTKITSGASMVLEVVKKMPIEERDEAIELGEGVTAVTAANQKLCEVINGIIDRKNEIEQTTKN